jgi:hypothetical protein
MSRLGGARGSRWRRSFPRTAARVRELEGDRPATTAKHRIAAVAFYGEQAVDRGLFGGRRDRPGPAAAVLRGWAGADDGPVAAAGVYKAFVAALERGAREAGEPAA